MKPFTSLMFLLLLLIAPIGGMKAGSINWLTNYDEATKISRSTSKPMLLLFTGTDWCSWCMKLEEEALNTADFADLVADKFVFVKLDFPLNRKQIPEIINQNKQLKKQFAITGYPTVVILDPQQRAIGTVGYRPGGGKQFGFHLLKMLEGSATYQQKMDGLGYQVPSGGELRLLYNQAISLKREKDAHYIAATGLNSDQRHFFLLESYRLLSERGLNQSEEGLKIKQQLLSSDPTNSRLTHYQIAVIDFDVSCRMGLESSPEKTAAALVNYIQKFGNEDKDNNWRLQMLISQVYLEKNRFTEALQYAQASYLSAPPSKQAEIATAIHGIEDQIPSKVQP